MNIFFFAASNFKPDTGGIAELGHRLATSLSEAGHTVFVFAPPAARAEDAHEPYRILRCTKQELSRKARAVAADHKPDLLFVLVIGSGWRAARSLARRYDAPLALYVHGLEILKQNNSYPVYRLKQAVKSRILKRSDLVLTNSFHTMLLALRRGADPSKTKVLHPGIEPASLKERPASREEDPAPGQFVFFTMGRLVKRKGIDQVLRAVALLKERYPNILYVAAGSAPDSYKQELNALARELSIEERVRFLGRIDEEEKELWYRRQDAFIMPSRHLKNGDVEGFGIVFLEAGLYGKPVIGGDSGGVPDAVEHEASGLLVDPEDPETIARAMASLMDDSSRAQAMGEYGKQRAVERFNWSAQGEECIRLCSPPEQQTMAQRLGKSSQPYFNLLPDLELIEPIDQKTARENLGRLKQVFDKEGIPFFIFFGTLLGALREKGFILHDTDTDVVLFESHREAFIRALPKLEAQGIILARTTKEDRVVSLYREGSYIDIYFARLERSFGRSFWYLDYSSIRKKDLLSFRRHNFLGLDLLIPERSEAIMKSLYGRDWKTPIEGYEASHDYRMKLKRFLSSGNKWESIKRFLVWRKERKGS